MSAIAVAAGSAVISGGLSYLSSRAQSKAAESAANAQAQSSNESNALARWMYEQEKADLAPFRDLELQGAQTRLNALDQLYGEVSGGFEASPAYTWNLSQGANALDRSALSSGVSRNADQMSYASGLASNEYQNYLNTLAGLGGTVSGYQNAISNAGTNYLNTTTSNNQYAADAQAQAALAKGQNTAQTYGAISQVPSNALSYYYMLNV